MELTTDEILVQIRDNFSRRYKSFGGFKTNKYYQVCLEAVKDEELLSHIIFCNDVLQIPPAKTFLCAKLPAEQLGNYEKRAIGALWGFVFTSVFKYRNKRSVTTNMASPRTATYYFEPLEAAKVVRDRRG